MNGCMEGTRGHDNLQDYFILDLLVLLINITQVRLVICDYFLFILRPGF